MDDRELPAPSITIHVNQTLSNSHNIATDTQTAAGPSCSEEASDTQDWRGEEGPPKPRGALVSQRLL